MDLWIRSQSKEKLVKIENIYISDEIRDGRAIMGCNSAFINQDLGTYATKERALEVLDEIQSLIDFMVCKEIFTYDSEDFMQLTYKQIKHIEENGCIYEMPKE